jgi:hypothetical protein
LVEAFQWFEELLDIGVDTLSEEILAAVLLRDFTRELHNKNAAVFVGAGLSRSSGYVDWKGLLEEPIRDLGLDPNQEVDLVTVAQYYCNQNRSKSKLTAKIFEQFSEMKTPHENHRLLTHLPIQAYWTTNYDKLIETSLIAAKKVPDVKYTIRQLATTKLDRDVTVFKMHGDIDHPSEAVINKDDYESYSTKMQPFVDALRGDLIERTFLFLGFSFTDPNIDYILSRVRIQYDQHQRTHYSIQRRVIKDAGESIEQFERRALKQQLFLADLKRFGIHTVLVNSFDEITDLLRQLVFRYRRSSVFISGAAHEYGRFSPSDSQAFLHELASDLSEAKNRMITGFGLGVGSAIINGTLANLSKRNKTLTDEDLVMRPFPQFSTGKGTLSEQWTKYRNEMIEYAGIGVFVFGNKLQDGKVVESNGIAEEFSICRQHGVIPVPVGCTGYLAESLWKKVLGSPTDFYPGFDTNVVQKYLQRLRPEKPVLSEVRKAIVEFVRYLQSI